MRLKLAGFLLCFFIVVSAQADTKVLVKPGSPLDISLDEIAFNGLQFNAVVVDMYLYTGWDTDDKKAMNEDSIKAIKHLDNILRDIDKQNYPKELEPLKEIMIKTINAHEGIYKDIDKKDIKAVSKQLAELWDRYTAESKVVGEVFDFSLMGDEFKQVKDPSPVFENKELESSYKDSFDLLKQKKYRPAFEKLSQLRNKLNKESAAYDFVTLRLCDVIGEANYANIELSKDPKDDGPTDILNYSQEILLKNYSPLFYEFFVRWRTEEQELNHGMSNWVRNIKLGL